MSRKAQQIRFCTSDDGARIAYATVGSGPPLIKAANWLSHLEFDWNSPVWRHWLEELSGYHTLIRYDERGCGLSDWNIADFSLRAWVRDLEAVVDATGLERFPLLGISQGGPIAIDYAVRHPEKVSHLILYGSYARGVSKRELAPQAVEEMEMLLQLVKLGWGKSHPAFRQVFTMLFIPEGTPDQFRWFNDLQRVSASPENAARMMREFYDLDVREQAAKLDVPTLVLHAQGDLRIPFAEGRLLASLIPDARFVPLDSKNHILLEHEPAWQRFLSEVRGFLGIGQADQETILFRKKETGTSPVMTSARWRQINALFERAVELPTHERQGLLSRACQDDPELRREVETLLESDAREEQSGFSDRLGEMLKGSLLSWQEIPDVAPGRIISHYEVIEKLGEGGMGTIYKARDRRLERFVALKFLPHYLSINRELKRRFVHEAKAAASLDHPNICTVYEIGETTDAQLYISMPCYTGETLKEKIERGALPVDEALDYARQIAEGLAHAHEAGIVHRDIKPANLFVTEQGRVKILDFGIAKASDVDLTGTGMVLGTVAYMSPEQTWGASTDHRTDLWSLGVVLYELLAGRHPFAGLPNQALTEAIRSAMPQSVRELRPDAPEALDLIVKRLLAKEASERYYSAAQLRKALDEL